jgi:hypothetical protein
MQSFLGSRPLAVPVTIHRAVTQNMQVGGTRHGGACEPSVRGIGVSMAKRVTPFPESPPSHTQEPVQLVCMIGSQRVVLNWTAPDLNPEPLSRTSQTDHLRK